ncbi:MAG: Cdc6/Cdc18 family protein [Candidatus Micrarchaeia archaeon]|jgi:cell division control protein 6
MALFKHATENNVIRDERPLLPDYLPPQVLHRETQIKEMALALEPAASGRKPRSVIAYGPTGTGKTTCTRYVLKELQEFSSRVLPIYVNCWQNNTRHAVLSRMAEALGAAMPRRGVAVDEVLNRVMEYAKKDDRTLIAALDEVDFLFYKGEQSVFYDLSRSGEIHGVNLGVVSLTNNASLLSEFDARIRSSFAGVAIEFKPYNPLQLKDILRERAKLALFPQAWEEEAIALCAAHAAKLGGDARVAIECFLNAARNAERENKKKVEAEDARKAFEATAAKKIALEELPAAPFSQQRKNFLESGLSDGEKMVVSLLSEASAKGITSGELYEKARKKMPGITDRSLRNYVCVLEKKGLVKAVEVDGRTAGLSGGRTRLLKLA